MVSHPHPWANLSFLSSPPPKLTHNRTLDFQFSNIFQLICIQSNRCQIWVPEMHQNWNLQPIWYLNLGRMIPEQSVAFRHTCHDRMTTPTYRLPTLGVRRWKVVKFVHIQHRQMDNQSEHFWCSNKCVDDLRTEWVTCGWLANLESQKKLAGICTAKFKTWKLFSQKHRPLFLGDGDNGKKLDL